MLIIEGSDLVGKTTFAQRALKIAREQYEIPAMYKHFGLLPKCWRYYTDYLPHICDSAVCDRFVLSECMYSACLGREENISDVEGRLLQAQLDLRASYTVVLTQPDDVIRDRWREGEAFSIDQVLNINHAYHGILGYNKWGLRVDREINQWTDEDLKETVHDWVTRVIHVRALTEEARALL